MAALTRHPPRGSTPAARTAMAVRVAEALGPLLAAAEAVSVASFQACQTGEA